MRLFSARPPDESAPSVTDSEQPPARIWALTDVAGPAYSQGCDKTVRVKGRAQREDLVWRTRRMAVAPHLRPLAHILGGRPGRAAMMWSMGGVAESGEASWSRRRSGGGKAVERPN